jgi:hypothetical protein
VRDVTCLASSVADVTGLAREQTESKERAVTCLASSIIDVTGLAREQSESCNMPSQQRNRCNRLSKRAE